MESKFLSFNDNKALEIISNNHVLAFPTETVYGLGIVYDSKSAFDELVGLKKRPPTKPFTVMISSISQIDEFAYIDQKTKKIIDKYFPGEITLILKSKPTYSWVNLNQETIGIRMSALKELNDFISKVGKPMLVTSANISGEKTLYTASEVQEVFKDEIEGIVSLDSYISSNLPSTIVMIIDDRIELIRQGSIPFEDIKKIWEGK